MTSRSMLAALTLLALSVPAAAQGWLDAPRWLETAQAGEVRALGLIDGDTAPDLLLFEGAHPTWTGMRALRNDGTGQFDQAGPLVDFAGASIAPMDFYGDTRLRDLTGDGRDDAIACLHGATDNVLVYPSNGDGSFGTPYTIALSGELAAFAMGDVEGDGVYELAISEATDDGNPFSNDSFDTRWWKWNGAGFTPSAAFQQPGGFETPEVNALAIVDADQDGLRDIVIGGRNLFELVVLSTQPNGDPLLTGTVPLPLPTGPSEYPQLYPIVGDLAGGGAEDLWVVDGDAIAFAQIYVIPVLQEPTGLVAGALQTFDVGGAGTGPGHDGRSYALADWNGDGIDDLLEYPDDSASTVEADELEVWLNDGTNTFVPLGSFPMRHSGTSYGGGAADFDGDGHLDFAGSRAVAFGNGEIEHAAPAFFSISGSWPSYAADWEGDGDTDLYHLGGAIYRNDGTGFTKPSPEFFDDGLTVFPPPEGGFYVANGTSIADFDGDGRVDYLAKLFQDGGPFGQDDFIRMLLLSDDGKDGFPHSPATDFFVDIDEFDGWADPADVDGDGDTDVFDVEFGTGGGYGWHINDGTGFFGAFRSGLGGTVAAVVDADADGDLDVYTRNGNDLALQRNSGTGQGWTVEPLGLSGVQWSSVATPDLTGNGIADLIVTEGTLPPQITVLYNDGVSTPFVVGSTPTPTIEGSAYIPIATELAFEDVDGDGIGDLIGGRPVDDNALTNVLVVHRGLGGPAFEPARQYVASEVRVWADFDADGDLDGAGRGRFDTRRFDGSGAGVTRQYGVGTAGTDGRAPMLGAKGPLRPATPGSELRIVRGLAGAPGFLLVGSQPNELLDFPFVGMNTYIAGFLIAIPLALDGAGEFALPLAPFADAVPGFAFYHQGVFVDAGAPDGFTATNGLELVYGLP